MQHAFPGDRLKISAEDWNRVRRVADNGSTGVAANPRRIYADMAVAMVDPGGISARTSTTLGTGIVTFYGIDTAGGILTETTETATVYNISSSNIAGNKYVVVARETRTLQWVVIVEDCDAGGS